MEEFSNAVTTYGRITNPLVASSPNVNMDTSNWGFAGKGSIKDVYEKAVDQQSWSGYATPFDEKKGDYNWLVGGNGAYRVDENGNIILSCDS